VEYIGPTRTLSNLIFACPDCNIENGTWTDTPVAVANSEFGISRVSAVRCAVDVNLVQGDMTIGTGGSSNENANVSAVETVYGPGQYLSPYGDLGDVAEWMATVATTYGDNIYGAQPMWYKQSLFATQAPDSEILPVIFTTTETETTPDNWTQNELKNFISVGSGALALSIAKQWNYQSMIVNSTIYQQQILPRRALLLLAPVLLVLTANLSLAASLSVLYSRNKLRDIQQAGTREIIWNTQNHSIAAGVERLHSRVAGYEELESLMVQYGSLADDHSHLGLRWVTHDAGEHDITGLPRLADEGMEMREGVIENAPLL